MTAGSRDQPVNRLSTCRLPTPECGDKVRCDYERDRAEAATLRLRQLTAGDNVYPTRVACACQTGQKSVRNCNYGRLCGSLSIGGRDAGRILISEGLALRAALRWPKRRPWCDS